MRIIYPYAMHLSDGHTYMLSILQFLNALAERVPVDLLSLDTKEDIEKYMRETLSVPLNKNLNVVTISNKKFGIKSSKLFFSQNVLKHIKKYNAEDLVIYSRDFKQLRLLIKRTKATQPRMRFFFEAHQILSQNHCREGEYKKSKAMRKLERYVFSNVDGLVCITSTLSNEIKKSFPDCEKNHCILPVGFNKDFLDIQHATHKPFDLIYSGNFSKWKGLDTLIEAVSIAKLAHNRKIKTLLIGATPDTRKHYQSQIDNLGISDTVTIVDRVAHKEINRHIANSKVGILSNNYDTDSILFTSPLKLYEYLGAGLKVVVSRLPAIESNIDESLVYYAKPENPHSFATAILKALDDKSFNADHVRKFSEQYTWESRAKNFMAFISEQN